MKKYLILLLFISNNIFADTFLTLIYNDKTIELSTQEFNKLKQEKIITSHEWNKYQNYIYQGPNLHDLIKKYLNKDIFKDDLLVSFLAKNNYIVTVNFNKQPANFILATSENNKKLNPYTFGDIWMICNFQTDKYCKESDIIWQLKEIEIEDNNE